MIEVDTFEHAGLTVRICAEEYIDDNDNPRKNCDGNIGVMYCEHRDYTLGDEDAEDPRGHTIDCDRCQGDGECEPSEDNPCPNCGGPEGYPSGHAVGCPYRPGDGKVPCEKCEGDGTVELSITDYLKSIGCRVALPLFLYDHSGITMSCGANLLTGDDNFDRRGRYAMDGAGWDTSSVGIIYHSPELCERWGRPETDDAKIEEELRDEVATYATYLEGGVYYYNVLQAVERDGQLVDPGTGEGLDDLDDAEVLDSCGGFLDANVMKNDSYTRQEARLAAECAAKDIERERELAQEWAARGVLTITN